MQLTFKREDIYIKRNKKNKWFVIVIDTNIQQPVIIQRNIGYYQDAKLFYKEITKYPISNILLDNMEWAKEFMLGGKYWKEDFGDERRETA